MEPKCSVCGEKLPEGWSHTLCSGCLGLLDDIGDDGLTNAQIAPLWSKTVKALPYPFSSKQLQKIMLRKVLLHHQDLITDQDLANVKPKLTDVDPKVADDIYRRFTAGETKTSIGKVHGMNRWTVTRILDAYQPKQ